MRQEKLEKEELTRIGKANYSTVIYEFLLLEYFGICMELHKLLLQNISYVEFFIGSLIL